MKLGMVTAMRQRSIITKKEVSIQKAKAEPFGVSSTYSAFMVTGLKTTIPTPQLHCSRAKFQEKCVEHDQLVLVEH